MGATDTSFIKAYEQKSTAGSRRGTGVSGVHEDDTGITVSTPVMTAVADREAAVSHLYAAADRIRTRSVSIKSVAAARAVPSNIPGVRIDGADPVMPPAPHLPVATLAAAEQADANPPVVAPEAVPVNPAVPAESSPVAPSSIPEPTENFIGEAEFEHSITMDDVLEEEIVEEDVPAENVLEEDVLEEDEQPEWRAQWEVDAVAWPEIVRQLSDQWSGELSSLIRPLLTSAWQGENVIAVTSFNRGEGATTLALCLARMAAAFRVPVALIDGDLTHPEVGTRLGLSFGQGWNTLPTELSLTESAITSNGDELVILPGSAHLGLGNEASTAYHALDELSKNFELVILDAGPIFTAARSWFDGPAAEKIHGTLIVQDMRETTADQVDDICSRLGEVGMDQVAIIENFRSAA